MRMILWNDNGFYEMRMILWNKNGFMKWEWFYETRMILQIKKIMFLLPGSSLVFATISQHQCYNFAFSLWAISVWLLLSINVHQKLKDKNVFVFPFPFLFVFTFSLWTIYCQFGLFLSTNVHCASKVNMSNLFKNKKESKYGNNTNRRAFTPAVKNLQQKNKG